jgi:ABC-type lipoprotein release transport system permease subunit
LITVKPSEAYRAWRWLLGAVVVFATGIYPAQRAVMLSPVKALKFE